MTITIPWWAFVLVLALAGVIVPGFIRQRGDYDFGSAWVQLAIFGVCEAAALGILIGHFVG